MTTLQLVRDSWNDSWTTDLTDTGALRIQRFRPAVQPVPIPLLTAREAHTTTARAQEVPWLYEIMDEMRTYEELALNWDSYGGEPVRKEITDAAVVIARLMALYGFSRPDICPESSGGILMEWESAEKTLTVDLDSNEGFSFAYESPDEPESEGDFEDFVSLLNAGLSPI